MLRSCLQTKILVKDDANRPFCNDVFSLKFWFDHYKKTTIFLKMKERGIEKNKRTIVKHPDKIASSVEL